jgi:hypothetical protein
MGIIDFYRGAVSSWMGLLVGGGAATARGFGFISRSTRKQKVRVLFLIILALAAVFLVFFVLWVVASIALMIFL